MEEPFVADGARRAKAAARAQEAAKPKEAPTGSGVKGLLARLQEAFRESAEDLRKLWMTRRQSKRLR
jgi:hypothetical protein